VKDSPQASAEDSSALVERARHLLVVNEHATVATVTAAGEPWNTPVYFGHDRGSIYWSSKSDAQHSQNIRATGRAFLVIYDSSQPDGSGAGLYVDANVVELADEREIEMGLTMVYGRRKKTVPPVQNFLATSPHRVYRATPLRVWVNVLHADEVPWDERVELNPRALG
jgi:nitroimidazol reductase NimA-like FMN-containing flavoprotein (pyridoxamine 5'-phosphate oxidase superfamily)